MPMEGVLNVDPGEGATRIFDNVVVNYLIRNHPEYYKNRVERAPDEYTQMMLSNKNGRIDLDGICPYNPDPGPDLVPPTTAQLRAWCMGHNGQAGSVRARSISLGNSRVGADANSH